MTADGEVGDNVIARLRPTSTLAVRLVATGAVRVTWRRQPTLLRTFAVEVAVTVRPEVRVTVITGAGSTPWSTVWDRPMLVATSWVVCAATRPPHSRAAPAAIAVNAWCPLRAALVMAR
jgi:hypothetical protein